MWHVPFRHFHQTRKGAFGRRRNAPIRKLNNGPGKAADFAQSFGDECLEAKPCSDFLFSCNFAALGDH
jgi:hypothetical protein